MTELNSTTNALSTIGATGEFSSWFSLIVIMAIATALILLFTMTLSNVTRYRKIRGFLKWFLTTIGYFFFGIGGLGVLAVPTLIIFYFGKQASEGNTVPIWITLVIIAGYFIIAGLGYIFKHYIYNRIKMFEEEVQEGEKDEVRKIN